MTGKEIISWIQKNKLEDAETFDSCEFEMEVVLKENPHMAGVDEWLLYNIEEDTVTYYPGKNGFEDPEFITYEEALKLREENR